MRRILIAIAATALLASCASSGVVAAAPAGPGAYAPTQIPYATAASRVASEQPAGAYALDGRHASVTWKIRHAGVGVFVARFDKIAGTLTFDPQNPTASSITATVAADSLNTGVLNNNGERAFDREIHTQAFGSEANPEIKFVSRSIAVTGPSTGTITGDLTLKGVTRPVTLDVTFNGGWAGIPGMDPHARAGFSATGTLKRSEFGIGYGVPPEGTNMGVSDEVQIVIEAEFTGPDLKP